MKRIALLLLSLFVLVGCTTKMPSLDTGFKQGLSKPVSQSTNHKKRFMRYYTPPHVGVKKADTNSTLFTAEGFDVLMRLSIDKIVSENFDYDKKSETEKTQDPVFEDSASYIDIQDESARHAGHAGAKQGGHYQLTIVSTRFNSLSRIERQRLIYNALDELMQTHIHALAIRALTPEEL